MTGNDEDTRTNTKAVDSKRFKVVMLSLGLIGLVAGTGCATSMLLEESTAHTYTKTVAHKEVLVEDSIIALGRPAEPLPNMPSDSVVIVGEKHSYVLTTGGREMVSLLSTLSPQYIDVDNDMAFFSPNNDGYFQGAMSLSYAKPQSELQRADYEFFLQSNGTDCTTQSDSQSNKQRFCFNVPVKGAVYPQVSNLSLIQSKYQALSKPYAVSIYTETSEEVISRSGGVGLDTLVILPFALAFDVITLPFSIAVIIAN